VATGQDGPRLAVTLSHIDTWTRAQQQDLVPLARLAEAAGVDQLVLSEHVSLPGQIIGHPGASKSDAVTTFPFPSDEEYPEPLVALAAIATATSTARLSTNILVGPLRPPVLLAKMAATLDVLSDGRLDLGIGVGWLETEFNALGVPYADRGLRLDEGVAACRALWEGAPATFEGTTVSFRDMHCSPRPRQARLPVWFGGAATPRVARRVVTLGDGWSVIGSTPLADIERFCRELDQTAEAHSRDPEEITVRVSLGAKRDSDGRGDVIATLESAAPFVAAGADVIQLPPLGSFAAAMGDIEGVLEQATTWWREHYGLRLPVGQTSN
jgi:probable F420-dependent oxidoreductase